MTTSDALLAAVLASPADDLPRLVFADWLDENGSPDLAAFIRVSCERAKTVSECGAHLAGNGNWLCRSMTCPYCPLVRREHAAWLELSLQSIRAIGLTRPDGIAYRLDHGAMSADGNKVATFRRGFVAEVRCTLADWCGGECGRCGGGRLALDPRGVTRCPDCNHSGRTVGIGPAVVARHPVERVVLTDVVTRAAASDIGRVTRESAGELFDRAFPPGIAYIVGNAERLEAIMSAVALLWAKSQPHPARIHVTPVSVDIVAG